MWMGKCLIISGEELELHAKLLEPETQKTFLSIHSEILL